MKLRNILVVVVGLATFAIGIFGIAWARFSYTYWQLMLIGITGTIFALLGLEFFHYGLNPHVNNYRFFSRGFRGLFFDILHLSLAILLTLASAVYQRPSDPLCGGDLSGGFPLAFLCDNVGESPIHDWGIITWNIDMPNLLGTYIDVLFYLAILWIISFMALRIIEQLKNVCNSSSNRLMRNLLALKGIAMPPNSVCTRTLLRTCPAKERGTGGTSNERRGVPTPLRFGNGVLYRMISRAVGRTAILFC